MFPKRFKKNSAEQSETICGPVMISSPDLGLVGKTGASKRNLKALSLLHPEEAKTRLLCKWIVKAMEPGKYCLQIML